MLSDVVFALRLFRRERAIVVTTVLGVAVAIGMCTAMFAVVDRWMSRASGIEQPGQVYWLRQGILLLGTSLLAALLPARRASRVDPAEVPKQG